MTERRASSIAPLERPKRKMFGRSFGAARISPESAERMSRVSLVAWNALGGDAAIAFLNGHDDALNGRPIELAAASVAGCEAVERALAARASKD